jgi:CheY-like chemotaxis protein
MERYPPLADHPLDLPPRSDPGARQQFGDPLRLAAFFRRLGGRIMVSLMLARHRRPIRSLRGLGHDGVLMLFGRHKQIVKRILIVEDEPLTAFDNENFLGDAGYEVVATIDDLDEALEVLESEQVDLILSDVRLRGDRTGIELARHAKDKGIPTLFATGQPHDNAHEVAVGCLLKPYSYRQLCKAIESVDRHLQGHKVKPFKGLSLFVIASDTAS